MRVRTLVSMVLLSAVPCGCVTGLTADSADTTSVSPSETTSGGSDDTSAETTPPADESDRVVAGVDLTLLDLPSGEAHEEYVELVDDTGVLQVEVPAAWSDVTTEPKLDFKDGEPIDAPSIIATTDFEVYGTEPRVDVVNYAEVTSARDPLERRKNVLESDCEEVVSFDYDDGSYTGLADLWSGCYEGDVGVLVISVLVNGDHLLAEVMMASDADIDAAIRVIETFGFVGD